MKVNVEARSYSLNGKQGTITFRWQSNKKLSTGNKGKLVERIEMLIESEITEHESSIPDVEDYLDENIHDEAQLADY